LNYNPLP